MGKVQRKRDVEERLIDAVIAFVEKRGGKVAVVGGIEIQQWPDDLQFNFRVAVKCTGKRPQ